MEYALYWLVGIIVSWVLLYYIIKAAVMNGIRDSGLVQKIHDRYNESNLQENKYSIAELSLKKRYENGEITFDEYKSEWNKLRN